MILIDRREGSKELLPVLSKMGIPVQPSDLEFGDVSFIGTGPDGPTTIGIEYKKLNDLIQSWKDGRYLGHQLPGMQNSYEHVYLLVEGIYRCNEDGEILQFTEKKLWKKYSDFPYKNLTGWLMTLATCYGVRILWAADLLDSAVTVAATFNWWDKPWENHGGNLYVHAPEFRRNLLTPSLKQKVAFALPGVGLKSLGAIEEKFTSVRDMINATPDRWKEVIGIKKAKALEEALCRE